MAGRYDNYSFVMLADELGDVKAELRGLDLRKEALEAELKRRGGKRVVGERWVAERSQFERRVPDTGALKAWFGEQWVEFQKVVPVTQWRCAAIERRAA